MSEWQYAFVGMSFGIVALAVSAAYSSYRAGRSEERAEQAERRAEALSVNETKVFDSGVRLGRDMERERIATASMEIEDDDDLDFDGEDDFDEDFDGLGDAFDPMTLDFDDDEEDYA